MSAVSSQNDLKAVRDALEKIIAANEAARRICYDRNDFFNENFLRFSVHDLHLSLEKTAKRKLPKLVEEVLADFKFTAHYGSWAIAKHDAPYFLLCELPRPETEIIGIKYTALGYAGKLMPLGAEEEIPAPVEKPKKEKKPVELSTPAVRTYLKPKKELVEEDDQPVAVAVRTKVDKTLLETSKRKKEVEKLSPEEKRKSSGVYQQLNEVLMQFPFDVLATLAETLNIGELDPDHEKAVNDILNFVDYDNVRDAAENVGVTLKARTSADAALLEFLIAQSK